MSAVIQGHEPIEVRDVLLIAHERLADLMLRADELRHAHGSDEPRFADEGTIALCMALRELAEAVQSAQPNVDVEPQGGNYD